MPSRDRSRRGLDPRAIGAIVLGGSVLVALIVMLVSGWFGADEVRTSGKRSVQQELAQGAAGLPPGQGRDEIAVVLRPTALRATPGGRRLARMRAKTEFGSARVVAVVAHRGGWLRAIASELPNGRRGWIDARDTQLGGVEFRMRVDLSAHRIEVVKNGRVVRRIRTAVGEQGTPTPTGTFAITDKVPFVDRGSPYGCCALALSAHQPDTPSEWSGGDRIAIHATPVRASIGRSVTLGCMRVPSADARWLMAHIPLGTRVSVRA